MVPNTTPVKAYIWHLQQYPILSALVKFGVAFPLTYHLLGGMRHMVRAWRWRRIVRRRRHAPGRHWGVCVPRAPLPSPPPPSPPLQAWDNVYGQNALFVRNTGVAAVAVAGVVGLGAMVTQFERED